MSEIKKRKELTVIITHLYWTVLTHL